MTRKEYLYTVLQEECGELIQACSKVLRFGEDNKNPYSENYYDNEDDVLIEFSQLMEVLTMLQQEKYLKCISAQDILSIQDKKRSKVNYYLEEYKSRIALEKFVDKKGGDNASTGKGN